MKQKKVKKQRPNVHVEFALSDEACKALSDALLFLLNLRDFSFDEEKLSSDSANQAEEKLFDREMTLTRGEVRATAKAIDTVLLRLPDHFEEFAYMEEGLDYLLEDLKNELPTLQQLQPVFQTAVSGLRKMK